MIFSELLLLFNPQKSNQVKMAQPKKTTVHIPVLAITSINLKNINSLALTRIIYTKFSVQFILEYLSYITAKYTNKYP